jgi:hypothetical protein
MKSITAKFHSEMEASQFPKDFRPEAAKPEKKKTKTKTSENRKKRLENRRKKKNYVAERREVEKAESVIERFNSQPKKAPKRFNVHENHQSFHRSFLRVC